MPFVRMELVRTVAAPVATVRAALARALRELRFEITSERVTGFEAQRGSQLAAGALQMKKSPVGLKVDFEASGQQTTVSFHLFDRWRSPIGKAWGMNRAYTEIFNEIAQGIDRCLSGLDPNLVLNQPELTSSSASVGFLEGTNMATGAVGERAAGKADQWLGGAPPPVPGSGAQVVIALPGAEAIVDATRVQGMLTVALLVARSPGSMPPALAADVERVATQIERVLDDSTEGAIPVIQLADGDKPVISFLNEQARVRDSLPLRTLQRCTTCRHEKVVNPDYKRLVERNRKIRGIGGFLGASISSAGVSPFILVGRILPMVKMDPDYVCPRCQGLDADESLVVFCPTCGERRDEAVLRTCRRCEHDFRKPLKAETLWLPVGTAAERFAPPQAPVESPVEPPIAFPPSANGLTAAPPPAGESRDAPPPQPTYPPGYYADPQGRFEARWWDGFQWTPQVIIGGRPAVDPAHAPASQ